MDLLPAINRDEAQRLHALQEYRLLDTPEDEGLDRITRLAALMLNAPVSTITLIDSDRQFFKARVGVENRIAPRSGSFCGQVVDDAEAIVVLNAQQDTRFAHSPYVQGDPHIRFYAGVPLVTPSRFILGTLCVYDFAPRDAITREQRECLYTLARVAVDTMELRRVAVHDCLTNLLTKGAFQDSAKQELNRAARSSTPSSVVVFDIDHFKRVNDTYGHPAGDEVLRAVAGIVTLAVRPYDICGRIGGEEFAILLPSCSSEAAVQLAERLRAAVETAHIVVDGVTIPVTASFGVSSILSAAETSLDTALVQADQALYRAKHAGRNLVMTAGRD